MTLKQWNQLPDFMQNEKVRPYYLILKKHSFSLIIKRLFDIMMSSFLLILLLPIFSFIAIWIKFDSKGPVFFRQERVTAYGKIFKIFKFRTMVNNADKQGSLVTIGNDARITKVGAKIRACRLDEIPQLINVFLGDMTFVGTRPEVQKFVNEYSDEMYATLLLPAGITSNASIHYKDEDILLENSNKPDDFYVNKILPDKMKYNLDSIIHFNLINEVKTMFNTIKAIL